jgi:hypothetical protein
MDKQMIEEMYQEFLRYKLVESTPETFSYKKMCEYLYGEGYRKIPEGSVVLTREEYEGLKLFVEKYPSAIKETAEKFAEMLKARLEERKKICLERWKRYEKEGEADLAWYWNGKENEIHCVKADTYEICKEITEGKV